MFTINIYLRYALMAIGIIGGIVGLIYGDYWIGIPLLLMGIILTLGFVFMGTVQSAAMLMQKGDLISAEKRLGLIWNPNWLYGPIKASYWLMLGMKALYLKDLNTAEGHLKTALDLGLPTEDEKAMVLLQLSQISASKQKMPQAMNYLKQAKKLNPKQPQIVEQMKQIDAAMKQRGQMKHMHGRQRGGRMRR